MKTMQLISRCCLPPLLVAAALLIYRVAATSAQVDTAAPIAMHQHRGPWKIAPRYDEPRVVTDEQLAAVLDRVKPPSGVANTNNFVHALRLWGPDADFGNPQIPTGEELRSYFLDDRTFQRYAGAKSPPLFYVGADGPMARSFDDQPLFRETSSYHLDDLLATLGETGTPLDAAVHLRDGATNVDALLQTSLRRFHLQQLEHEWTTIVYARYVFPRREWKNKYGERIDVGSLIDLCIQAPLAAGQCNGLHRLEALAVLYRADEQVQALAARDKRRIIAHMRQVSALLADAQTVEGYWNRKWPGGRAALADKSATVYDKILVTGHHLEWLALAPEEVQPPREAIVRAGQWLTRTLLELDDQQLLAAYGPYSHAARALCLWRSVEPFDAWKAKMP